MQHKGHPVSTSLTSPAAPLAQPGSGQSRPPARRPWFSASWADRLFAALARGAYHVLSLLMPYLDAESKAHLHALVGPYRQP